MISPIPAQWRLLAMIGVVAALCGLSAAGGATVATWKASSDQAKVNDAHAKEVARLVDDKHQLELAIAEQNKGVAVAQAQTQAAEAAQQIAQKHADDLALFSKSRLDKLEQAFTGATSCDAVLKAYWELRK